MLPCWWGVALSESPKEISFYFNLLLFFIGAVAMRSAGCIINDLTDKDFDKKVECTKNRPLAAGHVSSRQAIMYFLLMCVIGFCVFLFLSYAAKGLSLLAFVLLFIYPWMKRFTYWPQLVLGLAFNSGVLIAYAHIQKALSLESWLVYGMGICWTLAYDTIYAFQDIQDDLKIGVKSTAILFKNFPKVLPSLSYGGMISLLIILHVHWVSVVLFSFFAFYILMKWNPNSSGSSLHVFKKNQFLGWIIFVIFIMG